MSLIRWMQKNYNMADLKQFLKEYNNFIDTFKSTSFDSEKNEYLCNDTTVNVINFDKIIKERYPDSFKRPSSFDALYIIEDDIYLIEFKNQFPKHIINAEIKKKLLQGKEELDKLLSNLNIQKRDYTFKYCVIYKNCLLPKDRYKCGISKNIPQFGLSSCKTIIDEIYTNNVNFFTKTLNKKLSNKLAC